MTTEIHALSHKLYIDAQPYLTSYFTPLYDNFNKEIFDSEIGIPNAFEDFVQLVYNAHKQSFKRIYMKEISIPKCSYNKDSKDVLLGFSAGLDSVYQAIALKEQGYNVKLFYLINGNMYENGQSYKWAKVIAEKLNMPLITAKISPNTKKDNPYRKFWAENPIKNQYIMAMMVDTCIEYNIQYISMGDDFNLDIEHAAIGINLTDAKEMTQTWLKGLHHYLPDIKFIPIENNIEKDKRIEKLIEYNLQDYYYSCVQSGRFNQKFHKTCEEKYNIKLFHNNCGTYCRKCAMHNLILYYKGIQTFPEDFINKCWERMWNNAHSADYVFFSPDIPLEQRIKNLLEY